MQPSLEACASKLDRAQEHYAEHMEEHNAWMSSGPVTFASHFESDTGWWIFTASCKKISLRYSNIVGDCISNLRAALDHLVTQLVIANGGSPTRNHQFPIYDSGADFDRAMRSRLAGVAAGHVEIIRAAQPFTAGASAAKPRALAVLNDLSNRDKHRM